MYFEELCNIFIHTYWPVHEKKHSLFTSGNGQKFKCCPHSQHCPCGRIYGVDSVNWVFVTYVHKESQKSENQNVSLFCHLVTAMIKVVMCITFQISVSSFVWTYLIYKYHIPLRMGAYTQYVYGYLARDIVGRGVRKGWHGFR